MAVNILKVYVGGTGNGDGAWAPAGRYGTASGANYFGVGNYLFPSGTTVVTLNGTSTDGLPPAGGYPNSPPLTIGTVTQGVVQAFPSNSYVTSITANGVNWRSQIAAQESLMDVIGLAPGAHRTSFGAAVVALPSFASGTPSPADVASLSATVATIAPTAILGPAQVTQAYAAWSPSNWATIP